MLSSFFDNILTKQGWKQVVKVVVLPFCTVKSYKKYNFIINSLRRGTYGFANFPYKLAIFEWGFWAIIALLFPWTPGSKQCEIGGFLKGITCPCALRGCKVAGCQTFFIFQKLHFSFYISYCHMKTAPPMNTFDFFKY